MVTTSPPYPRRPLRTLAAARALRRHHGSALAAGAQVGLALVVVLGSIGLASVAALIVPGAASPEEVVAATATHVPINRPAAPPTPRADARAGSRDAASPPTTPHR